MVVSPEGPAGSCEHLGHGRPGTFTRVAGKASYDAIQFKYDDDDIREKNRRVESE